MHGSANSSRLPPTTPPDELQARRGLLPHRLQLARRLLQQHLKGKGSPLESQSCPLAFPGCGIISKIKVLHLKIKVYMKNVAVFTH